MLLIHSFIIAQYAPLKCPGGGASAGGRRPNSTDSELARSYGGWKLQGELCIPNVAGYNRELWS